MNADHCSVAGCDRTDIHGRSMCRMHYFRWYRTGKTDARPMRESRSVCVVDACDEKDRGPHGYCGKHLARMLRNGDPLALRGPRVHMAEDNWRWTGSGATYTAMHQRVRVARGKASLHLCVDCGARARHWSYDRRDPAERSAIEGPYSVNVEHYEPRCVSCHKKFDLEARHGS